MKNPPLVSVVIPTYNRAYCIERTIASALAQTYQNLEILIVDDGSTDDTKALISRLSRKEPRLHYIYQDNAGVASARNHGFRLMKGEYVALLDSDDIWKPWKLELQLSILTARPDIGMVWTDMEAIAPDGNVFDPCYLKTMYDAYEWFTEKELFTEVLRYGDLESDAAAAHKELKVCFGDIYSQMLMGNLVHTSTVLIRRDILDKVKGFNEDLMYSGEDYDFHLRTCREAPVAFLDTSSTQYQKGFSDQLTQPKYEVYLAGNFLKTIKLAFERDGDRIRLPAPMIRQLWAGAYQWAGEASLDAGKNKQARHHLFKSLTYTPWQPRTMALLFASHLPPSLARALRNAYARIKNLGHAK